MIPPGMHQDESMRALIWEVGSVHNLTDVRISTSNYQRFQTAVSLHATFRKKYGKRDKIARGEQNLVDTITHRCNVLILDLYLFYLILDHQWSGEAYHIHSWELECGDYRICSPNSQEC